VVAPAPTDEVREVIVPIRRTIEVYALKSVFDSLKNADFRNWEEILHRLAAACRDEDEELIALCDIEFHRLIIQLSGNADLLAIWQAILVRVRGHFQKEVHRHGKSFMDIHAEHFRLAEMFCGGNKDAALEALGAHIW